MIWVVALLWALYASECFVRCKPGDWVFRPEWTGGMKGVNEPDVTFFDGRFAFAWASLLPWRAVHVFSGAELDPQRVRDRLRLLNTHAVWLRGFSASLFGVVLIAFPVLIVTEWLSPSVPILLACFAVAWAGTLVSFLVAHRRIHRSGLPLESWLVLVLSPLSLIRSPHTLSVSISGTTHPVVAADALCGDDAFLGIARLWHFDCPDLRAFIESLADSRGLRELLFAPPAVTEAGTTRFCRRCHATFTDAARDCPDCEDVVLSSLALPPAGAGANPVPR